jgi:hypothetical protein
MDVLETSMITSLCLKIYKEALAALWCYNILSESTLEPVNISLLQGAGDTNTKIFLKSWLDSKMGVLNVNWKLSQRCHHKKIFKKKPYSSQFESYLMICSINYDTVLKYFKLYKPIFCMVSVHKIRIFKLLHIFLFCLWCKQLYNIYCR